VNCGHISVYTLENYASVYTSQNYTSVYTLQTCILAYTLQNYILFYTVPNCTSVYTLQSYTSGHWLIFTWVKPLQAEEVTEALNLKFIAALPKDCICSCIKLLNHLFSSLGGICMQRLCPRSSCSWHNRVS
jgi:hypothetical protein